MVPESIQKLIETSGHNLPFRAKGILEAAGWKVETSKYYSDLVTGKPREIDLVATKNFLIKVGFFGRRQATITIRFFIECKHLPGPVVFWMDKKRVEDATKLAKDNSILRHKQDACLRYNAGNQNLVHHYVEDDQVAKVWNSGKGDAIFESVVGSIHSQIFFENLSLSPYTVNFPLVLVEPGPDADLIETMGESVPYSNAREGLQVEMDYAVKKPECLPEQRYFLVDVVKLTALSNFLKKIEDNDIAILKLVLDWSLLEEAMETNARYEDQTDPDPYF